MSNDKLRDLTIVDIGYQDGERPTAQKLEGGETQTREALEYIEATLGDAFGESLQVNPVYISNFARDIGDRSLLNPVLMPDISLNSYVQDLTQGVLEHELDLIPLGIGSGIISQSNDGSIVIGQFKNTVKELTTIGDWTILPGLPEGGAAKNSRKLVTHGPSTGGTIIFTEVTSGRGSTGKDARHNVIPSIAQAENNGDFVEITELDALNNIYSIKLPKEEYTVDRTYDHTGSSISNTKTGVGSLQQLRLPKWLYDVSGLDMGNLTAGQKDFPLNVIRIYDWTEKKVVSGLLRVQSSPSPSSREFEIVCTFKEPIFDYANRKYMIVTNGNSLADFLGVIQRDLYFHKHLGDDMIRGIKHADLFGLRTGHSDITNRAKYYGPSSIINNDHSQYLHRDGFTISDIGAGGNAFRGDLLVGNKNTGIETEHENYNLIEDSFSVSFGMLDDGGKIYFDKERTQNLAEGRGNIPQNFTEASLVIEGATSSDPLIKTVYLDGNLRASGDIVLGTLATNDVFIPGDLYIKNSVTLIPRTLSGLVPETGMMTYSSIENAPVFWNGNSWINAATGSAIITVGDGTLSDGKYNGTDATTIQNAINEASTQGGGQVYVLRGNYSLGSVTINIPSGVSVTGDKTATNILSSGTCFSFSTATSGAVLADLQITGSLIGVENDGTNNRIEGITFTSNTVAISLGLNASKTKIGGSIEYTAGTKKIVHANVDKETVEAAEKHIGFSNDIYILNPINKSLEEDKWVILSGTGGLTYEDSTDSMIGKGRWRINGLGIFEFNQFMPVMPEAGIGGYIGIKKTGTAIVSVGFSAYDADLALLPSNGGFILNNDAAISTTWDYKQEICVLEGSSGEQVFPVGTRFIKLRIDVTDNSGDIYFDGFNLFPMNFATMSLYS